MRYYYYGIDIDSTGHKVQSGECIVDKESKKKFDVSDVTMSASADNDIQEGGLIIDDDTVYEIDEECLRCKNRKKK